MTTPQPFTPPHPLNTAVLFLVFNRLDTTKQVFEAIRQAKPPRLYIAADGAREAKEGEAEKVQAVRDYVMQNIDWGCEVKTFFRDSNVGCGPNVKESIDWFFENEEAGVILEDDCLPDQSFFYFCENLLAKYAHDDRIAMIAGTNHLSVILPESYCFSKYKACWGWATWKRSWKNMDFDMCWRNTSQAEHVIVNMGYSKKSIQHWKNAIQAIDDNRVSTWDWQWYFSIAANSQLTIFPKVNLISNIGFGSDSTHTNGVAPLEYTYTKPILFPLVHPALVVQNSEFDRCFEKKKIVVSLFRRLASTLPAFVKQPIKYVMRKI